MLPNKIRPFEDETLDSWVYRLAIANGFDNVKSLIKDFFKEPIYHSPDHTFKNLFKLLDAAGITDYSNFILHHTIYSVNSLFLNVYRQSIFLDMLSGNNRKKFVLVEKQHNYCPVCFEEDGYLKTYHNMPGVSVCPIHKTALLAYLNERPIKENIDQKDIDYAVYCYRLYQINADFDDGIFKSSVSFEKGVEILMEQYPNLVFPEQEKIKLEYDNEYTVLRAQNNLVESIHKLCGTHFCINAKAFNLGFKCPVCRESEEEFYAKMINNTGKYKLIKYEGVNIVLNNKECDNTYKTRISSWVNGARCECETDYTIPKLRKIFANEYPEFEIIDYHNERLYLKHKACGQEFDVTMKNWKKKQSCRICDPRFELNVATVGKAVEEKGFKLIKGEFLSQNRMITIECPEGHRKEVGYYSFMEYSACPVCNVLNNSIEGLATKFIKENYTEDDVVYLADLKQVVENPRSEYLTRLGYKKIATGMYCRHDLTDEEIIEQKYLYRKKHIGYSYGESFAYELGMMNKPEIYSCCTLMDSGPKGRFVQIRDTKLRIKGVIKGFDSDYWREWQLLDFLYAVNKYRGNKTIDEVIDLIMDHINSHDLNKEYLIGNMIDKKSIYIDGIMEKLHEKKKQEN